MINVHHYFIKRTYNKSMEKTNVLFLLTPKAQTSCLKDNMNIRQALEKMKAHGHSAIPLITKDGEYIGTVSEGDLLNHIVENNVYDLEDLENVSIKNLKRREDFSAVKVEADISELVEEIVNNNFVPVVDDRNVLMGIVTRKTVMQTLIRG